MARSAIEIALEVVGAAKAKADLTGVSGVAGKIGANFAKFRGPAVGALAAVGAGAGGAIRSASDLNETVSKSSAIFGANAGAVSSWADGAAKNLGLSKSAALESAAGFGDMFSQIGFAGDQAAKMSTDVVGLSADLGSFNNLPTADVSERISAAFRGEYDSLQAVIPNISAARVESEAMAATGKKTAKELTAQEKATAVLAIVSKDGSRAVGDFAKTSGGAANQQKIAAATAQDLAAKLGQQLLPAYTFLLAKGNEFLTFLTQHSTAVGVVLAVVGALAAGVLVLSAASTIYTGVLAAQKIALGISTAAQWLFNAAMTANPIGLIVVGVALLIAGFVLLYRHSETFRNVLAAIGAAGVAVWGFIKAAAVAVWSAIVAVVRTQLAIVGAVLRAVVAVAAAVWGAIKAAAAAVWSAIVGVVRTQIAIVGTVVRAVVGVASAVWNKIKSAAGAVWSAIASAFSSAVDRIKRGFSNIASFGREVLAKVKGLLSPSALVDAGRKLIQGLADGIGDRIGRAVQAVRDGVQRIKNLLPGSPIKEGPLKGWNNGGAGKRLMGMLRAGITAGAPGVRTALAGALDDGASFSVRAAADVTTGRRASVAGTAGAAGGARTINITVNVPRGATNAEVGREVASYLKAYERESGR